jgi:hypothetical protein
MRCVRTLATMPEEQVHSASAGHGGREAPSAAINLNSEPWEPYLAAEIDKVTSAQQGCGHDLASR